MEHFGYIPRIVASSGDVRAGVVAKHAAVEEDIFPSNGEVKPVILRDLDPL